MGGAPNIHIDFYIDFDTVKLTNFGVNKTYISYLNCIYGDKSRTNMKDVLM